MKYLVVDGYLNGTGIRDKYNGGFVSLDALGLDRQLTERIEKWLTAYWDAFYNSYDDADLACRLDSEGMEIAKELQINRPDDKIEYFSDIQMKCLLF